MVVRIRNSYIYMYMYTLKIIMKMKVDHQWKKVDYLDRLPTLYMSIKKLMFFKAS